MHVSQAHPLQRRPICVDEERLLAQRKHAQLQRRPLLFRSNCCQRSILDPLRLTPSGQKRRVPLVPAVYRPPTLPRLDRFPLYLSVVFYLHFQ